MVTPVLVKVAVAAVTDKPQLSETQHRSYSVFACVVIHFGVPCPVATGDSETMFKMHLLRCLWTPPSYQQDGEELGEPQVRGFMDLVWM